MTSHHTLVRALIALAALFALAGCGSGSGTTEPQVASLPTTPAAATGGSTAAGSTTVAAGRPQERLDDSPQRHDSLIQAWDDCLLAHGAVKSGAGPAGSRGEINTIPPAARAACMSKEPLGPPELDPAQNPNYRADWQADVACMRAHGVRVHLTSDPSAGPGGLTWTFDDDETTLPDDESQIEQTCQLSAFSGKK